MLFTLPFLLLLSFFLQFPVSDQLPHAANKTTASDNSTDAAAAKLPKDVPSGNETAASGNSNMDLLSANETVALYYTIKKGGGHAVTLINDLLNLMLDTIDIKNKGYVTEEAINEFMDSLEPQDSSENMYASDAIGKIGVKLLKVVMDKLWKHLHSTPGNLNCETRLDTLKPLGKVKIGFHEFFADADTNGDKKLTHGEVTEQFNLLKSVVFSKICKPVVDQTDAWWCKEVIRGGNCQFKTIELIPGKPIHYDWYCGPSSESADEDPEAVRDRKALINNLRTIKCGLDAFFRPTMMKGDTGDGDQ